MDDLMVESERMDGEDLVMERGFGNLWSREMRV